MIKQHNTAGAGNREHSSKSYYLYNTQLLDRVQYTKCTKLQANKCMIC